MPLRDSLQAALEKRLAETLIVLGLGALTLVVLAADHILPVGSIEWLGTTLSAQVLLGLLLLIGVMAAWIVYLQRAAPKINISATPDKAQDPGDFIPEINLYRDKAGLHYCRKCRGPVGIVDPGWHCVSCNLLYESPEFKARKKERLRREDEQVRAFNRGKNDWMA